MKIRTFLLLFTLIVIAVFAILNWNVFTTPTMLSLGIATVEAPFGLVMLGIMVFMAALFLVFIVYLQSGILMEARRNARELHSQRELADKAEASRFTELREYLAGESQALNQHTVELRTTLLARIEQMERELRAEVEQSSNTLAAYMGELGDRIDRKLPGIQA